MNINIQPKQSSMSTSVVNAMITLTTEEIVVNTLAIPKGDAYEWNKKVMVERYE